MCGRLLLVILENVVVLYVFEVEEKDYCGRKFASQPEILYAGAAEKQGQDRLISDVID